MNYRKKPVVIEAMPFNDAASAISIIQWAHQGLHPAANAVILYDGFGLSVRTLEGTMHAAPGDWIIKGVKNEFYSCKPDIFEATYEPVT